MKLQKGDSGDSQVVKMLTCMRQEMMQDDFLQEFQICSLFLLGKLMGVIKLFPAKGLCLLPSTEALQPLGI